MNIANVPARTVSITRYVLEFQNIFSRGFLIKIYVNPYGRDILAEFTFLSFLLISHCHRWVLLPNPTIQPVSVMKVLIQFSRENPDSYKPMNFIAASATTAIVLTIVKFPNGFDCALRATVCSRPCQELTE